MATVVDIATRRPRPPLPHNDDLEASILGGVITRNEMLALVPELETADFYDLKHRIVWDAIRNLQHAARPIDVVTVELEIERSGKLDAIGGIAFLGELTLRVPTADNVRAYADDVRQLARNRRAIEHLSVQLDRAERWPHDAADLIGETIGELGRLEDLSKPPPKRLKLISVAQSLADLEDLARAPVYPTPFPALNDAIGFDGLLGTQVYTVAAGTGRGKTTWVSHVAAHSASIGIPVIVAVYELKPGYFVARKVAGELGRHSNDIIRGDVPLDQVLGAMPYRELMYFMHRPTLADLREAVSYVKQKHGTPPLVVVDYIQKLADEIASAQQRPDLRLATNLASATLCDIAEKTGAAVIAVSAIGRGKGKILGNPRKLPPYELVEVAKESGAVEYDGAGLIVLSLSDDMDGDERVATITLAKARFGSECHIDARYDGRRGTWRTLDRVNVVPTVITPKDTGELAAAIERVIRDNGPQSSKTKIWKLTGRNKPAIISEVDAMIERGQLVSVNGYFMVPAQAVETPAQKQLDALIREASDTGLEPRQ